MWGALQVEGFAVLDLGEVVDVLVHALRRVSSVLSWLIQRRSQGSVCGHPHQGCLIMMFFLEQ